MIAADTPVSLRRRAVPAEDLLVLTTDLRGVITGANTALARVSGHLPRELVGEPASLLRHPDLPSGLFRLLWQRLADGRPAVAHLTNRSRDGAEHDVFSVIVPVRAGYLSVQVAPRSAQAEIARRVFQRAGDLERRLAATGRLDHDEIAAAGSREIERLLEEQGVPDYDALAAATLAAEVAGRPDPTGPRPTTGPLAEVADGVADLHRELGRIMDWVEVHEDLSRRLDGIGAVAASTAGDLHRAVDVARAASQEVAGASPALVNVAAVMEPLMARAVTALQGLGPQLVRLRAEVGALAMRLGLLRLQAEAVAAGALAVHAGTAPPSSLRDLPRLCDTVDDGVTEVGERLEAVNAALGLVASRIGEAGDLLGRFRTFLGQWRILVLRRRQGRAVAGHLALVDAQMDATSARLQDLGGLATECLDAVRPFERSRLEPALRRVRTGLAPQHAGPRGMVTLPAAPRVPSPAGGPARAPMPIWPGEHTGR